MSKKVKGYINKLFAELNNEVEDIIKTSISSTVATQTIMEYVSSKIASSSQSYMVSLYTELSKKTLTEEIFSDPTNANKFYELNLRQQISDTYHFDIKDLKSYNSGISFKEINCIYITAGVAAGSATIVGILLGVLDGKINIPIVVIIAGAILAGIAGGAGCAKFIPQRNKSNFRKSVMLFMVELEKELINWVDEVVEFYNEKVQQLKTTL